jgi:hypothetical protein
VSLLGVLSEHVIRLRASRAVLTARKMHGAALHCHICERLMHVAQAEDGGERTVQILHGGGQYSTGQSNVSSTSSIPW